MKCRSRRRLSQPACTELLRAPLARNLVWLGLACMPAVAQDATVSRPYYLVPTFNASAQLIDVRNKTGSTEPAELVMQLGPGLQMSKQSGRVQGTLDYQLLGNIHTRRSELNKLDNNLSAAARAEAVPGWMYVDAKAHVSKQTLNALGQQSASGSLATNSNQREVLNVQVSPYVRGELPELAQYELRLRGAVTEVRGSSFGDSNTLGSSVSLSSLRRGTVLGWGLQASQDRLDYKGGRATDNARASVSVSATPDPDLSVELRAGQESTNVSSLTQRTYDNYGAALRWSPSPRTLLSVAADRRYFGDSFQVTAEHRLRQSAFRFTSTRDASTSGDVPQTLFQWYDQAYKSTYPDPIQRAQLVIQYLLSTNQNPFAVTGGSFATSAVTLQRRDDLSYSYLTPRSTFTVRAYFGTTELLDNLSAQRDIGRIEQQGLEASVAHKLTPTTSATLLGSLQKNSAQGQADSDLKSLSLNLTTAVNRNTTASAGARYGVYGGASNSNREIALTGSLSMRF